MWRSGRPAAAGDPADALSAAQSISDERWKAVALASIARAISTDDPVRAARLTTDAVRVAQSVSDEESKESALGRVAEAWAATDDPGRAEDIAQSITYDFAALAWPAPRGRCPPPTPAAPPGSQPAPNASPS